ncbi:MAG: nucleotide exchange factor GrpE [Lachnospiraceae bacterium]|nr:nucleotide exchange factor GrpE [Lachnospiraceae bacterium]
MKDSGKKKKEKDRTEEIKEQETVTEETAEKTAEEAEKEDTAKEAEAAAKEASGEKTEPEKEEEKKDPKDAKIEELNDRVMRQMAEFDNFRKRTEKEKEQMFEVGAKSIIEKILPIIDNFERALTMAGSNEEEKQDPFMDGMEMVYRQLMDELEKAGVTPIEAVGKDFDPEFHNAVMQEEGEEGQSGKVIKELQKGYMYRDSVVRHSMVCVGI